MSRIQELRKEAGMTQAELAAKIGVNPVTMSRYENGDRHPKIDKLEKMAELFVVTVDYLLGYSDSRLGSGDSWDELAKKMNSQQIDNSLKRLTHENYNDLAIKALLSDFDKLNDDGKKEALKQIENLTKIPDYQKD